MPVLAVLTMHGIFIYSLSHYAHTGHKKLPVIKLVDSFDASFGYVANEGSTFYFKVCLQQPSPAKHKKATN